MVSRVGQVNSGHCPLPLRGVAHTFTGDPRGKRNSEASHLDDSSTPLSVFLLYYAEIITLLLMETNRYYHDHLDRLDEGPSPLPEVTEVEMLVFLAITIQMGQTDSQGLKISTHISIVTL
jgi:hypothetical protein